MNSTLRKLSKPGLSGQEIARLLQRHVGDATSAIHCDSAITALKRIHDIDMNSTTRVLVRMLASHGDACAIIKEIIDLLQSDAIQTQHKLPNNKELNHE